MTTFHPFIGAPRRDGSRVVYIAVTHHRTTRRLPTTLVAMPSDLTRGGKIKNAHLLSKCDGLISQFRAIVSTLSPFAADAMNVDEVVAYIRKGVEGSGFRLDFLAWARAYALNNKEGGTCRNYLAAIGALDDFREARGLDVLDVNDITKTLLQDFHEWDSERGAYAAKRKNASSPTKRSEYQATRHLAKLAHIFEAAKRKYNDEDAGVIVIPRSPFSAFKLHAPLEGGQVQKALPLEVMQRIITAETADADIRLALDAFVLSFGLMGANLADLYEGKAPTGGVWRYERRKTRTRRDDRAAMCVRVDERLTPYVARLSRHARGVYWLPTLRAFATDRHISGKINTHLARWCRLEDLDPFTFYAARKTWATLARNKAGIDKATVDECLCHRGDLRLADIYIERDWGLLDAANARVLDLLRW